MDTHFPGSIGHMIKPRVAHMLTEIENPEVEFISPTKVRKAIWSFGDLKAAGPDELKPIVLKHLGEKAVNKLIELIRARSLLGYVPLRWRKIQSSVHSETWKERLLTSPLIPTNFSLLLHYESFGESLGVATRGVGTHSKSPKLRPACFLTGI